MAKLTDYIPTFQANQVNWYVEDAPPSTNSGFNPGDRWTSRTFGTEFIFSGTEWKSYILDDVNGDVQIEGDLTVKENFSTEGLIFADPDNSQALSGPGAINITQPITLITTTGADAFTLAAGTTGQFKNIVMVVDGGDATITPTGLIGGTTITFDAVGDTVQLYATGGGWLILGGNGYAVA